MEPERIGQILNTNPLNNTLTALKSEARVCACGKTIQPIVIGPQKVTHWLKLCRDCLDRRKAAQIREDHRQRAAQIRNSLAKIIPPLFKDAHLKLLSSRLREKILSVPPNKGLLLYGPPGIGKSFAMCALMRHYRLKKQSVQRIKYDDLCLEIRDTYNTRRSELDVARKYQQVDKLLIEDVGTTVSVGSQESDFSLRTFLLILDYRLEHCKPTFITTNKSVDELAKSFDERVASRLHQACEIIPLTGRDKRKCGSV